MRIGGRPHWLRCTREASPNHQRDNLSLNRNIEKDKVPFPYAGHRFSLPAPKCARMAGTLTLRHFFFAVANALLTTL